MNRGNKNLIESRFNKADEFYTQLPMIEEELQHYTHFLKNKIIYCNCDDYMDSNFVNYFINNFNTLGIKKLIATSYAHNNDKAYKFEMTSSVKEKYTLKENGSYLSHECIDILKQCDIVITNPPFSSFKLFFSLLMKYHKKFIIIGNLNNATYKNIFPLIQNNIVQIGYNSGHYWFKVPDNYEEKKTDFKIDEYGQKWRRMGNICWFTNLDIDKKHTPLFLSKTFDKNRYLTYDNYNAIECSTYKDIPNDYFGLIGVPVTYLPHYCPEQFKIIDKINPILNGENKYTRLLIQRVNII